MRNKGQALKLREQVTQPNIFFMEWIKRTIYKHIQKNIHDMKVNIRLTEFQLESMNKVGGTLPLLITYLEDQGFLVQELIGWREFDEADQDSNDVVIRISW
jgi:hypothetical protein